MPYPTETTWDAPSRRVVLDAKALARAGASQVLALDPGFIGRSISLLSKAPATGTNRGEAIQGDGQGVAIVSIDGPMAQKAFAEMCGYVDGYDAIAARVFNALGDASVGAVVLVIDSPGGDVAGLEESIRRMVTARDALKKPIFAYVDELAASAAYWLACSVADGGVFAPPAGLVGSIGAIGALVDETAALEAEGVKVTLIREPEGKADGHPAGPVPELATERATVRVKAAAGRFFAAVATKRGLTTATVRGFNGAIFEAPAAMDHKLIDGVESLEDVLRRAAAAIETKRDTMSTSAMMGQLGATDEAEATKKIATLQAVAKAAANATGETDPERIAGVLAAMKQNAEHGAKAMEELAARIERAEAAEKDALIKRLRDEKRLSAAMEPWAREQSAANLQAFAACATPYSGPRVESATPTGSITDPDLVKAMKSLNITEKDMEEAAEAGL